MLGGGLVWVTGGASQIAVFQLYCSLVSSGGKSSEPHCESSDVIVSGRLAGMWARVWERFGEQGLYA